MSLFDPYTHTQLHRLKQEELARKARRQEQLHADARGALEAQLPIAAIVRLITSRLARHSVPAEAPANVTQGRPALDS